MLEKFLADKEGGRTETLLAWFIEDRVKNYIARGREGVPRGNPIGFSEAKHKAALLCLTSIALKKQADMAGVSYDLLLKWRSEDRFVGEMERYAKEFSDLFYQRFEGAVKEYGFPRMQLLRDYDYETLLKTWGNPSMETYLFDDLQLWGLMTRDHVVKRLLEGARKNPGRLLFTAVYCIGIIRKDKRFKKRLERRCIFHLIREGRDILSHTEISEEDRQNVDFILGTIEGWLSEDES